MQSSQAEKNIPTVEFPQKCDFEAIFRQTPQFQLVLAPDAPRFTIIDATDAYLKNALKSPESFLGSGLFEAYPVNQNTELAQGESRIRASLERVLETSESDKIPMQKYDIPLPNSGGGEIVFEERWWSLLHTPIFYPACAGEKIGAADRKIRYILQRVDDVTHYVRALRTQEEEFARRNAQLTEVTSEMQRIIVERSEEVTEANTALKETNAKLARALQAAEAASRAKEEFQANISHEIRTPLNAVIGFAQLLGQDCSGGLSDLHREQIQAIHKAGEHLLQLIDQVLDAAKLDRGMMTLSEKPVSPAELLQECARLMRLSCGAKGLDFVVQIEPNLPALIQADPIRIRQMVLNLLSNAVKYTAEGQVGLYASSTPARNRPGVVEIHIRVSDTGSGISAEELPHLFTRYTQARGRPALGGTGLGLAIANDLAKLMNGFISVESQLGVGSQFTLRICAPVVQQAAEARKTDRHVLKCVPEDCDKRIIIVDDIDTNRQLLRAALTQLGFKNLLEYSDGADAVEDLCAWKSPPAIIFMDLYMPRMSGFEAAKIIRNLSWGQQTATIAVSASSKGSRFAENESLFNAFLGKPFSLEDLAYVLRTHGNFRLEMVSVAPSQPVSTRPHKSSRRFMVVDDNLLNQKVVSSMLERAGHKVEIFSDGFAAIERFSHHSVKYAQFLPFDFVILDKNMPGISGIETARRLRALEEHEEEEEKKKNNNNNYCLARPKRVTLLLLTADDVTEADLAEFKRAGIDEVLTKPLMMTTLLRTIQEYSSQNLD